MSLNIEEFSLLYNIILHNMKKLLIFVFALFLLTGCADVTPIENCVTDDPAGFFLGFWHGLIVLISFIGSIFMDSVAIYEVNNTGGWYDFGFILGVGAIGGSGIKIKF